MGRNSGRCGAGGSALLELLLAASLLGAAALALASLQSDALAAAQRAAQLAAASQLLQNMAAAMRANPEYWAAVSGLERVVLPPPRGRDGHAAGLRAALSAGADCGRQPCSAAERAAHDLRQWGAEFGERLPQAQASVQCRAPAPAPCLLQLRWQGGPPAPSLLLALWR